MRNVHYSALAAMFAAWTAIAPVGPAAAGEADNSLTWASITPPLNLDPYANLDREFNIIIPQLIWDTLVYLNPETQKYEPLLAKEWRWVDDKTIELKLRTGVKWHDGTDFTADDVVNTVNYVANPDNKAANQQNVNWMKSAEKKADDVVQIHLKAPFPAALEYLSQTVPILPKDFYTARKGTALTKQFVGTGPYKVTEFVSGSSIGLEATKGVTEGPKAGASFSKIRFRGLPDQSTQIAELLKGGIDWTWRIPADQAQQLETRSNLKVVNAPSMRISYLSYNLRDMPGGNPLQDKRVREAISLALDRKEIVDNVIGPGSEVANTPCYPTQFGCSQDVAQVSPNLARAKALLAEAGYAKGVTLEIVAWRNREWTEALAAQLGQAGFKVNVQFGQNSFGRQKIQDNAVHLIHGDWGSYGINDVSAILNFFFTGGPDDNTKDSELASWLNKAANVVDGEERKKLYAQSINKILKEIYWTPLWSHPVSYVHARNMEFKPFADENPRFFLSKWKSK